MLGNGMGNVVHSHYHHFRNLFFSKNYLQIKSGPNSESPIEILKRRYALGETTKEQFEEIKKNIS
jgi:uncharacterized membrane protein